ncbi:uncharacterized protein RHIMIDRAFT_246257 [Rhizopus microsporus ATCC 52813]|uniref:Proteasome assembly chaperone 1 n=1 Tax=Rhizopus microsporus ATCC 52813 TaxID=1340429 RepID=A0A2G4SKJ8_RHIZD|nr:uncharacterized protein RHIMIDRAFT_246257 [Rhizopus microsporus ATCC 52813]PHZ09295.1 hypothetical protein RHIMIDRAFT_246257 [Rhizopus microsporus ATCC 52813]
MDFDESFHSAPVRYALDEVDSDEELEDKIEPNTIQVMVSLPDTSLTLIFGLSGPGSIYIDSLKGLTSIGTVENKQETVASILQIPNQPIVFVSFTKQIEANESVHQGLSKVIILDSFTTESDLIPPTLRVLQSSASPLVQTLTLYEIPHMVTGLSAAIINYCEIHSIPCYNLLTLQEYVYGKLLVTDTTLEAYNHGLHQLGHDHLNFDSELLQKALESRHSGRIDDSHHRLYV